MSLYIISFSLYVNHYLVGNTQAYSTALLSRLPVYQSERLDWAIRDSRPFLDGTILDVFITLFPSKIWIHSDLDSIYLFICYKKIASWYLLPLVCAEQIVPLLFTSIVHGPMMSTRIVYHDAMLLCWLLAPRDVRIVFLDSWSFHNHQGIDIIDTMLRGLNRKILH